MPEGILPDNVDVILVGAGPTSLISAYILLKTGINVLAVEQHNKSQQALFGRACALYPRSLELLDTVGLWDPMADIGIIIRGAVTYKDGKATASRGWSFLQKAIDGNTYLDYMCDISPSSSYLVDFPASVGIRQKYAEDVFRAAISAIDPTAVLSPAKLIDYNIDPGSQYPVRARIQLKDRVTEVRSKYLVGADGGRSTVRTLAGIPFTGMSSTHKWIRLDAVVRTDMPHSRDRAIAIESAEHGNVLWIANDNGRVRIGFVCPPALYGENGENITAEAVMEEARKAVRPFSLEFVKLDWWTAYSIGQRLAETWIKDKRILLAGDAAHTHSSGAAQGLNTGIHDATNLAWKLAGVLKGWYKPDVLTTYDTERRPSAARLLQLDRDISSLISGNIPSHFNASSDADPNDILEQLFVDSAGFTVGLGISYSENILNRASTTKLRIKVGHRAPDAQLYRQGSPVPKRLLELTAYNGNFWILVFAGVLEPVSGSDASKLNSNSAAQYRAMRTDVNATTSFMRTLMPVFSFLTILRGEQALETAETIGVQPLGKVVYDCTGDAYAKYGVDDSQGVIVVLRPDAIVGFIAPLNGAGALNDYFSAFVQPSEIGNVYASEKDAAVPVGEISLEGHEESTTPFRMFVNNVV
ncbi:3-hydroxybenzoate 4-monooxygenase [Grifola frondosa]|uniref:3-hydroxybenzoate 4-monooxygenase n=1 Tax=Grifola frondosa TaxID=5627 RepID=A0A1C7LQP5_GRIFR|nr:3-hydroxybenzoate 4-monooxygenase [Grifola frondosa]